MGFQPVPSQLQLDEVTRLRLEEIARAQDASAIDVLRRALDALERQPGEANGADDGPSLLERAARAGLVGVVAESPADLSANPRHFDGFRG